MADLIGVLGEFVGVCAGVSLFLGISSMLVGMLLGAFTGRGGGGRVL
jgi:hypothetical protein